MKELQQDVPRALRWIWLPLSALALFLLAGTVATSTAQMQKPAAPKAEPAAPVDPLRSDSAESRLCRVGRALVQTALQLKPDAAILEVTLPHLSGIDAASQLRLQRCWRKCNSKNMRARPKYKMMERVGIRTNAELMQYAIESIRFPTREAGG